jgi:glycosyltransferase involved in cell wall biosynthesis
MSAERHRVRVLWLAKGLGPGGMERLMVNHAKCADRDRFDYSAAYLIDRPESVVPELEALDVPCHRLDGGDSSAQRWLGPLVQLVRNGKVDVVHSHSPLPAALSRPLLRARTGARIVYTEHNTWDCYGPATRAANAATYALDHATLAVSQDAKESVPRPLRRRVEVLTHGVDLAAVAANEAHRRDARSELGLEDTDVAVLTLAHLRTEKGHDVLLDAAARVLRDRPEAVFLVGGHGPLERELEERRRALGLGDRFRYLGFRRDALRLMSASDVFCLSSRQEGLPVAFMEACALGVPTVATRVGGLADHIEQGVSGLLVDPEDPAALAAALVAVIQDPDVRRRLAEGALRGAGRFDAAAAVRRQESVYLALLGSPDANIEAG